MPPWRPDPTPRPPWRTARLAGLCLGALLAGLGAGPLRAAQPLTAGSPALNYRLICMGCHLEDGSGMPQRGIPAMNGVLGHFLRLPEGRALIVQVPGVMNTPLNDRQVAELMNWLLGGIAGASLPPGTPPYTKAEVRALHASRPADVAAERERVVRRLRGLGYPID